jgi:uncharacterized protein YbaR (Trm112 family)
MDRNDRDLETCPQCRHVFPAGLNRAHRSVLGEAFTIKPIGRRISDAAMVACPACRHQFASHQIRFLGFLSMRQVRVVFLVYVAALAAAAVYVAAKLN